MDLDADHLRRIVLGDTVGSNTMQSGPTIHLSSPWTRFPKDGQLCPRTGLSRAQIYRVIQGSGGRVRTVNLSGGSKARGRRRFYDADGLVAYLGELSEQQRKEGLEQAPKERSL